MKKLLATLLLIMASSAWAATQTTAPVVVTLTGTVNESISISCVQSSLTITFTSVQSAGGTGAATGLLDCTTSFLIGAGHPSIATEVVFAGSNSASSTAMNNGASVIPVSASSATITGTHTGPSGAATGQQTAWGWLIFSFTNPAAQSLTETDHLQLNFAGLPALVVGTYTGTLNVIGHIN